MIVVTTPTGQIGGEVIGGSHDGPDPSGPRTTFGTRCEQVLKPAVDA